ncbi:uncharacterized protein LOC133329430 [Musca vetustissima]|uniref:uncharacterized protein LOC133329430 n=1 Tax=Musca vetustissima TaxID=27455 RepID=UPI002AB77CFF|nr:uncharacterized protein LOC133329430 [Musca vetustissima]
MNGIGCKSEELEDAHNVQSDESNQSFIMETTVSLESRVNDKPQENEKHKDPDLMLKSVERLTLEFVSSAEQLRTNSSGPTHHSHNFVQATVTTDSSGGNDCTTTASISNDTWDEDTCPNDVSFPSVSMSVPKIVSITYDEDDEDQATTADYKELNDFAENTPNIDELPAPDLSLDFDNIGVQQANGNGGYNYDSQPSSIDCYTDKTLVNERSGDVSDKTQIDGKQTDKHESATSENSSCGLNFKLGGIVQTAAAAPSLCFNVSAMTNSTFIAQEARKLANNLQAADTDCEEELTFSINSLDLDNIRPPSGMDSLNISGYYQDTHTQPNSLQNSPQMHFKSPKFPRKTLPAGLVARRALGQMPPHLSGSAESVNSSCNLLLDNIKPPSLMDELLDSMISVSSIQSEIADDCASMATTVTVSNYETANGGGVTLGGEDGDTITLRSYSEDQLPRDDDQHTYNDGNITPLPSDYDFSSAESTPKKSYTSSPGLGIRNLTPKQKRQVVKDRYRTYTIDGEMSEELRRKIEEAQKDETLQIEITNYETNSNTLENGKCNSGDGDDEQKQENDLQNTPRSRRRSSQERYRTQTISYSDLQAHLKQEANSTDITSTSNYRFTHTTSDTVLSTDQTELNTKLDQDLTSLEYDQNSETESCHNYDTKPHVLTDCEEEQEPDDPETETIEVIRPRIVIPGEKNASHNDANAENGEEEQSSPVKAIRGGKKPQYVSPYSMKFQKTSEPSKPVKAQATTPATATKPNLQLRKPNGTSVVAANTKLAQKKPLKDAAVKEKTTNEVAKEVPPPAPLERQGTFVKDEPSVDASTVPVVETSPKKSKLSKLPMKRQLSTPSSNTSPQKTASTRKLPTSANSALSVTNNRRTFGGSITKPQRANSNVNIRVTTNAARIAVLSTRVSTTTPPSRSNSTLNSANAAVTAAQNAAAKINQAQSRIAGIWRRVDEAKNKQQTTTTKATNKGSQLSGKTANATNTTTPQPGTLVRSTTFDNSPPLTVIKPKAGVASSAAAAGKSNGSASTKIAMAQRQILGIRK